MRYVCAFVCVWCVHNTIRHFLKLDWCALGCNVCSGEARCRGAQKVLQKGAALRAGRATLLRYAAAVATDLNAAPQRALAAAPGS